MKKWAGRPVRTVVIHLVFNFLLKSNFLIDNALFLNKGFSKDAQLLVYRGGWWGKSSGLLFCFCPSVVRRVCCVLWGLLSMNLYLKLNICCCCSVCVTSTKCTHKDVVSIWFGLQIIRTRQSVLLQVHVSDDKNICNLCSNLLFFYHLHLWNPPKRNSSRFHLFLSVNKRFPQKQTSDSVVSPEFNQSPLSGRGEMALMADESLLFWFPPPLKHEALRIDPLTLMEISFTTFVVIKTSFHLIKSDFWGFWTFPARSRVKTPTARLQCLTPECGSLSEELHFMLPWETLCAPI